MNAIPTASKATFLSLLHRRQRHVGPGAGAALAAGAGSVPPHTKQGVSRGATSRGHRGPNAELVPWHRGEPGTALPHAAGAKAPARQIIFQPEQSYPTLQFKLTITW